MKINVFSAKMILIGSFIGISLLSPGCKKEKIDSGDPMSMLTAKEWMLSKNDTEAEPGENYQYYPWNECFFDDKWKFEKKGTYKISYGKVKCSDDEAKDLSGTYTVDFSKSTIKINDVDFRIVDISPKRLRVALQLPPVAGQPAELVAVFVR